MENILFTLTYLVYGGCTLLSLVYLFTKRESLSRWGLSLLGLAIFLHLASLGARCVSHNHDWSNWFATLSLFSVFIAGLYGAIAFSMDIPILGAFVMPLPFALLTYAWFRKPDLEMLSASFFQTWMALHIPMMFVAYALLAIAFGVGVAYLIQEHQIKMKHPTALVYRLPPLADLDRLIYRLVSFAFPLLTAGIVIGGFWAARRWGRFWGWDPKETWALITWLIYAGYFILRFGVGWRGRKAAYLSMIGFVVILFTYAGVNYFSPLHGYLSGQGR
ncbi:MAG TPA: cytochrome c biogenesis protein CcsA [Elusimicrobiota bacterium]|nr:cytochrome c biogenesis protein CcsA [Elusimicrobiota bacterium]